ncbi:FAD-dependent monooxygenase [Actinokineospora enzanensis]|uniref:FAD-dependent monooxygenase n=1 Tax=Actinokineospora enzanensis TaxID=155975 RepID=UPI00037FE76B|nr:FAD-dependent monooxygenase [Actinokineospora enzanensis]
MREPLRVAVVGAGIAGLTIAAALRANGLRCHVFEQTGHLREIGAGIQLSPNGTRPLLRLGLGRRLDQVAVRPDAIEVRDWQGDRLVARTELGARCVTEYGAPYYTVHRADLHQALLELLPEGILHLGRRCVGVVEQRDEVELKFDDGSTATADLVVGADGIRSVVRSQLVDDEPRFSGQSVFRALVPADAVPALAGPPRVRIWMGPGRHCVCYPVSGGTRLSIAASAPADDWRVESWSARGSVPDLLAAYPDWHPTVLALLAAPTEVTRWALHDRPPVTRWSSERTTLIGDAAHPMLPFGAQGAAQGIEDAISLAAHLRGVPARGVPEAIRKYEAVRRLRTERVYEFIRDNEREHHVADPTHLPTRDTRMRGEWSLRARSWLFGHDAAELTTESR